MVLALNPTVKSLLAMRETSVWSLGWEVPLEKEIATHCSILAWRIPWKEESFHGLAGYSPWGHKESDMTEWLHLGLSWTGADPFFTSFSAIFLPVYAPEHNCSQYLTTLYSLMPLTFARVTFYPCFWGTATVSAWHHASASFPSELSLGIQTEVTASALYTTLYNIPLLQLPNLVQLSAYLLFALHDS